MFKSTTSSTEVPTTERFIDTVLSRVPCAKHGTVRHEPCYFLPVSITKGAKRQEHWGVCNDRARKAGFVGVKTDPRPKKFHSQWNRTEAKAVNV